MKKNYEGHDRVYRKLRSQNYIGWDKTKDAYIEREKLLRRALEEGHAPSDGKCLELGCGAGNMTVWLAKQGYEAFGIDISPTAIEWANDVIFNTDIKASFFCGNVLNLNMFDSDMFDFVFDGHCFHCIIGDDRLQFLSESYRVLKPGGYLLIDTMCGPVDPEKIDGYDANSKCTVFKGVATRYFGSKEDIEKEVIDAGFQIISSSITVTIATNRNMMIQAIKPSINNLPNKSVQETRASSRL